MFADWEHFSDPRERLLALLAVSLRAALVVAGLALSPALLLFARARRQGVTAPAPEAPREEASLPGPGSGAEAVPVADEV